MQPGLSVHKPTQKSPLSQGLIFFLFVSEKHDNAEATGTNKQSKYTTAGSKGKIQYKFTTSQPNLILLCCLSVVSTLSDAFL